MKALALIPAALLAATPVTAASIQPAASITRGDATAIRSCREVYGGPFTAVCYGQKTEGSVSILDVPVLPITWTNTRTVRVSCESRIPWGDKSTRGQVVREFCPRVWDGTLAPAPFLLY
jgi:hypothetical protein